ncbi:VOC family protein [Nocardia rhamnosiphila]|uniref:VOC family protein n=1 Tax=Nocardia rhamnosiphila TaxID=426716 RepID=UPI0004C3149C|nr:VOC family protein [Nocardia rhamnosiphila]
MSAQPSGGLVPRPDGTFCWVDLKTRDPNAAAAFFERALGWTVETDQDSWRRATVIRVGEHRIGGLSDVTAAVYPPGTPPHIACYLAVDEVDARVAAAVEAGARLVVAPFDAGDDGRIATLIDPFGAAVSLWRRAPRRGWTHPRATGAAPRRLQHLSADPPAAAEFYQRLLGMADPDTDFTGLAKPNTVPGWRLIVAVDSVTEVQRRAGESHGGTGRVDPGSDRGMIADLTAPDGLTFSIEG